MNRRGEFGDGIVRLRVQHHWLVVVVGHVPFVIVHVRRDVQLHPVLYEEPNEPVQSDQVLSALEMVGVRTIKWVMRVNHRPRSTEPITLSVNQILLHCVE